jgi:hypothetical protein
MMSRRSVLPVVATALLASLGSSAYRGRSMYSAESGLVVAGMQADRPVPIRDTDSLREACSGMYGGQSAYIEGELGLAAGPY